MILFSIDIGMWDLVALGKAVFQLRSDFRTVGALKPNLFPYLESLHCDNSPNYFLLWDSFLIQSGSMQDAYVHIELSGLLYVFVCCDESSLLSFIASLIINDNYFFIL